MQFSSRVARSSLLAGLLAATGCSAFTTRKPETAPPAPVPAAGAVTPRPTGGPERSFTVAMDSVRARQLYVSKDPKDLPPGNYARDMQNKARTDSIYAARFRGIAEFRKVTYKSTADGMEIPAYLFAPLDKRGAKGHAAMVWVHGGVHGDWGPTMFPFVKEAVERGYVIITPDYRGSTGHGEAHHQAIDYGGMEVDDVLSALEYLKTLPYVDMDRVGMMGWSHGGFITILNATKPGTPLKAAAGIVPVTNLVFRLSYKGPGYQRSYAAEPTILGLPFEKPDEYIKRSPLYHVENLNIPLLVHVSTNDLDVNYVEDQQIVWKLRALKPELSETKIYVDPPGWGASVGHSFSRRVDPVTLQRVDSPEQIDSWNRTWAFFEWNLRPYEDRSKPAAPVRVTP
ncbi:MAG TPA: alpha/beta fold hydrolase [Gemmatimonadaceae bacterium]|jgi:dipeptidyl aminopeptidase/acylaminoacyl peptidase